MDYMGNLIDIEVNSVVADIGKMFLQDLVKLKSLQAERDSENLCAGTLVPPILPSQLVVLCRLQIFQILKSQREILLKTYGNENIVILEVELRGLKEHVSKS